jgi:hypothetical protein
MTISGGNHETCETDRNRDCLVGAVSRPERDRRRRTTAQPQGHHHQIADRPWASRRHQRVAVLATTGASRLYVQLFNGAPNVWPPHWHPNDRAIPVSGAPGGSAPVTSSTRIPRSRFHRQLRDPFRQGSLRRRQGRRSLVTDSRRRAGSRGPASTPRRPLAIAWIGARFTSSLIDGGRVPHRARRVRAP